MRVQQANWSFPFQQKRRKGKKCILQLRPKRSVRAPLHGRSVRSPLRQRRATVVCPRHLACVDSAHDGLYPGYLLAGSLEASAEVTVLDDGGAGSFTIPTPIKIASLQDFEYWSSGVSERYCTAA